MLVLLALSCVFTRVSPTDLPLLRLSSFVFFFVLLLHFWKHMEKSISDERAKLAVGCQRLSLAEIVQQIIFGMISARDYLWQWLL